MDNRSFEDTPAQHDALRRYRHHQLSTQLRQIVSLDIPLRTRRRQAVQFGAAAGHDRGARGKAFEAVSMERADAPEVRIQRVTARKNVPEFRMHEPVQRRAPHDDPAADTGADRDVHQTVQLARRSPSKLGKRCGVDIGVETDRTFEFAGKPADDIGTAPAGLGVLPMRQS